MPLVQVLVHREIDPQEGQTRLDAMADVLKSRPMPQGGWGKLAVEGATRHANPFDPWLREILKGNKFVYNDLNYCFQRKVKTMQDGEALMEWFDEQVRPRARLRLGNAVTDALHCRVTDDHEELADKDTY